MNADVEALQPLDYWAPPQPVGICNCEEPGDAYEVVISTELTHSILPALLCMNILHYTALYTALTVHCTATLEWYEYGDTSEITLSLSTTKKPPLLEYLIESVEKGGAYLPCQAQ